MNQHNELRDAAAGASLITFLLLLILVVYGCGTASLETRTAYSIEAAHCVANERAIVDREGTTREQDEADLAAERARCDAALLTIGGPR